jgi:hypothetical protein
MAPNISEAVEIFARPCIPVVLMEQIDRYLERRGEKYDEQLE